LFSHFHHWGKRGKSHTQRTHSNAIALLSSGEIMRALCLSFKYPFPFVNPTSARLRSSPERRLISTSSSSLPTNESSTSAYLGRKPRGVRGVICTLSSEVEMPGVRTGDLGISRGEFCKGGNGERLFRLRSREGMQERKMQCYSKPVLLLLFCRLHWSPRDSWHVTWRYRIQYDTFFRYSLIL
jgi:hypothetical protein